MNKLQRHTPANNNGYLSLESFLETLPHFADLKRGELKDFTEIIYVRRFRKNEPIFYEKEPGLGMYFIHEGSVIITKSSKHNGHVVTKTLTKGHFFGELLLVNDSLRTTTAVAAEDCCLIGIFRPELRQLINRKPRLGNKILMKLNQMLYEKLQDNEDELFRLKENMANSNFLL